MKNKLIPFLIALLFFYTNVVEGKSTNDRDNKITITLKSKTFFDAFSKIESLTNYSFLYESNIINTNKKISFEAKNKSISYILNNILKDEYITYKLIGNNITLKKKAKLVNLIDKQVRGKVINSITKEIIPFCNVQNINNGRGTSTNEEGEFVINTSSFPVNLTFSHLSFETKSIKLSSNKNLIISLNPVENILDEVDLSETKEDLAIRLAKKAHWKIKKGLIKKREKKYAKAFYRQKTQNEDNFYEFSEIFFDLSYNNNGILDWEIEQGRYALKNESINNRNFTLFQKY